MIRWLFPLMLLVGCSQPVGYPVDLKSIMSREQLNTVQTPLLAARLTGPGTLATMVPVGQNAGVVTWQSQDQVSLSLDHGLVVATRGLGQDLMAADVADSLQMLRGGLDGNSYTRIQTYLDGEYQTRFVAFRCRQEVSEPERIEIVEQFHMTTRIEESCFSPEANVANTYWVAQDGTIWKSRQWIGTGLGYMETQLLIR